MDKQPTVALIDVDQIVYACAIQAKEDEPDAYILNTAKQMLAKRIRETEELCPEVTKIHLFVSDKNNFRKWKDENYKGNRPPKPEAWSLVRDYIEKRGATSRSFLEADDVTAMNHHNSGGKTVLVDQDKDLDQIVGWRIVPSLTRGGKIVREATLRWIGEAEATHSFYSQLYTGDTSDNINGARGKPSNAKKTAEKVLEGCTTEWEMYCAILEEYLLHYDNNVAKAIYHLTLNANHLYMKRFPNDYWLPPTIKEEKDENSSS